MSQIPPFANLELASIDQVTINHLEFIIMSEENPICPKCKSPHSYLDRGFWICSECFHEWTVSENSNEDAEGETSETPNFLDANGVQLQTGDTVRTVKDLKVGGDTLKSGTKVKNIRLLDVPVNGHDISCKVDSFGSIFLKCSVVKKDS